MTAESPTDEAANVAREIFGVDAWRSGQAHAIAALEAGRDVQVVLPTGAGKSLCFQLPAVRAARDGRGPTLVISPLIALMEDQVGALRRRGVQAGAVHSSMSAPDQRAVLDAFDRGVLEVLYASPERFGRDNFRRRVARRGLAYAAVDEAHCISEWGHDFRPDYRRLGELKATFGVPVIAATATATPRVLDDISDVLCLETPTRVHGGFARPNLSFAVHHIDGDRARVDWLATALAARDFAQRRGEGRAIVYAATRRRARDVCAALRKSGVSAAYYHAGRTDGARARALAGFAEGRTRVLVATSAFGMGVDRPDVRLVAHVQAPETLAAYYQQAGRAGRDGAPADCVLLYGPSDAVTQARLRGARPAPGVIEGWRALVDYAFGATCRQLDVAAHFGVAAEACGRCDVCTGPDGVAEAVGDARARAERRTEIRSERALNDAAARLEAGQEIRVVEFVDALARPVSRRLVARGLRGSRARDVKRRGLASNPHFGALRGVPEEAIVRAVDAMLDDGRLARRGKKYPTVWIPEKRVLPPRAARPAATASPPLKRALAQLRREEAKRRRVKPYQVFADRTLNEIVARRPLDTVTLAAVWGMGPVRLRRYGDALLRLVADHAAK